MKTASREPSLSLTKVWEDFDISEISICAYDGTNSFSINVYAGHAEIKEAHDKLHVFKNQVHGGILDVTFGAFGPEYAYGAFQGRFHFAKNQAGRVLISLRMQSNYFDFGSKNVASEASLYLVTEPALLDNFIRDFSHLDEEQGIERQLECIRFE